MSSELKRTLCNELIDNGLVEENDVIRHSYTRNRLGNGISNMSRTESKEKLSPTLDTRCDCLGVVVKEDTLKREVCNKMLSDEKVTPYDIVDVSYASSRLDELLNGEVSTKNKDNNQISNTITTGANNFGVCVPGKINVIGNYSPSNHDASRIVHPDGLAPTVKENYGTVTATIAKCVGGVGEKKSNGGKQWFQQDRVYQGDIALAHPAQMPGGSYRYVVGEPSDLRIRKLTPKECWRLMGFDDADFEKAAKVNSNSQLYKQAGNSIVVNVLEAIFKELFVPKQTRSEWLDELLG